MAETLRYVAVLNVALTKPSLKQYRVEDIKEGRVICYCTFRVDAESITKAMNVANSWEPV